MYSKLPPREQPVSIPIRFNNINHFLTEDEMRRVYVGMNTTQRHTEDISEKQNQIHYSPLNRSLECYIKTLTHCKNVLQSAQNID